MKLSDFETACKLRDAVKTRPVYFASVAFRDPVPLDDGLTLNLLIPASSVRNARKRLQRYLKPHVVMEIGRV